MYKKTKFSIRNGYVAMFTFILYLHLLAVKVYFICLIICTFLLFLDNLIEFKPFQARFTNLGAIGRYGPTTLGTHYVGQDHEHMVTVANGIQFWTVPYSGTYRIKTVGAAGAYGTSGPGARGIIFSLPNERMINFFFLFASSFSANLDFN